MGGYAVEVVGVKSMHKIADFKGERRARTPSAVSHRVRTKDGGQKTVKYGRAVGIKIFCVECLGWETHPNDCTSPLCPLFPFRGITQKTNKGDK